MLGVDYTFREFENAYRLKVLLRPGPNSGFTVFAADLPGCISEGKTVEECLEHIKDAAAGVISTYLEDGMKIPWQAIEQEPGDRMYSVVVKIKD